MRKYCLVLLGASLLQAGSGVVRGPKVDYVGGTVEALASKPEGNLQTTDPEHLLFVVSREPVLRIAYDSINVLEYGQSVNRRYAMAVIVSPLFLLSKSRKHYLTIGYTGDDGKQQAVVFRVSKNDIRPVLVSLEAKSGRKVEYQDDEARKAR